MNANILKLCNPHEYYTRFLKASIYPDGRSINCFRPISLQVRISPLAAGSSLARQGGASVSCKIEPILAAISDSPVIVPIIQASPNISKSVVEEATAMINQIVSQNSFYSKDALKTANGRLTWILNLHITILSVDGAVFDALITCISGALLDLELPEASTDYSEDSPIDIRSVQMSDDLHRIPLADIPVSSTFIIYERPNEEALILCDPIADIFDVIRNTITVVAGQNERILRIMQHGVCSENTTVRRVIELAISRQKVVAESLKKACKTLRSPKDGK